MKISTTPPYNRPLKAFGRSLLLALGLSLAVGTPVAEAADEERRVLKARDYTQEEISDEYARMAEEKRMESIRRLKELLSTGDYEGEQKAEMMLRLADLYFQQGRALYLQEMAAFDKEYDACFNTEGCNPDNLKVDNSDSRKWQEKSIKLYENILRSYKRYQRADQATFFLGAALADLGREEEALEAFKNLTKYYQDSPYRPDAYVLIGEHYFDRNNAYQALRAYQKAAQYENSEKYPFALYKLGWCYYNVGDYQKSIDTMKSVVSFSMSQEGGSNLRLQEEALKDLVRFFADADQMDAAYEYFNKLGKKDLIQSMLKRLATMYFEQGKFEQSVDTYRRLILEDPQAKACPGYQHEIIQAYRKMGIKDKTLEEIDRLRRDYGKESAWARANASSQDAINDATKKIEENLRRVAIDYHNQARALNKSRHPDAPKAFEMAGRAYATYLEEIPTGENVYGIHYAYAELLYTTKQFDKAFEHYMAVVDLDPKGKHSRFCAESAIYAADEMVKKEGGDTTKVSAASEKKEAQPLTDWEQRLVDACAKYAELYPDDKQVMPIIYKSAYLLYHKYRFEEAAGQFKRVIQMNPRSKQAEQAANLILDSFVINEDWENLKRNAKFYFDQEGLGSKSFKKDVYNVYQRASFKVIEVNLERTGDKSAAGDGFVAFYEEFPEADTAAQALNNASIYYYDEKRVADAMKVRHILIEDPRFGDKTKYYYDQVAALGFDYETVADFNQAATYYEKLFALYPKHREKIAKEDEERVANIDAKASDALLSAAVFRNALGEVDTSVANYNRWLAVDAFHTDPAKVVDIRLTIAKIYEDNERWGDAANVYLAFFTKDAKDSGPEFTYFARLHHARALEKQNQERSALRAFKETVDLYKKEFGLEGHQGPQTDFVAEMMYKLAESEYKNYDDLEIKGAGPGSSRRAEDKAFGASVKKKTEGLLKVEGLYTEIVNMGAGEWGLAAIVRLGQAYEELGITLGDAPFPFYLTDDQKDIYRMTIEDKVYVQEEKAVTAYSLALNKSNELTLYNDVSAEAARRLGELRPDDFPGLWEMLLTPRYTATDSRNFDYEKEL